MPAFGHVHNKQRRQGILRRTSISPQSTAHPAPTSPPLQPDMSDQQQQLITRTPLLSTRCNNNGAEELLCPELLQLPDVQLQTSATAAKKATTRQELRTDDPDNNHDDNDVPFWLRPSPMQVYPYNFIMAVRKKLDLIANPTLSSGDCRRRRTMQPATDDQTGSAFNKKHGRNSNVNGIAPFVDVKPQDSRPAVQLDIVSDSDDLTNMSSISLQLPLTNPISLQRSAMVFAKPRSPKAPATTTAVDPITDSDSQATLSMSSAILSQSSPEKRQPLKNIEPLSTDAIADMRLRVSSHPFVNHRRGSAAQQRTASSSRGKDGHSRRQWGEDTAQQIKIPSTVNSGKQSSSSNAATSSHQNLDRYNIMEMLDSFNRSLSHAISVNQKLHETLSRPHQPIQVSSTAQSASAATSNNEYSSRFDSTIDSASVLNMGGPATRPSTTSLLNNESSVRLTAASSTTSRSQSSIQTVDVDGLTAATTAAIEPLAAVTTVASSSEPSELNLAQTSTSTVPSAVENSSQQRASIGKTGSSNSSSNIHTQLYSDSGSVARHFEPSLHSLDASNPIPVYSSPASVQTTARAMFDLPTKPQSSASTASVVTSSSTLTIQSLHITSRNTSLPAALVNVTTQRGSFEYNKENITVNADASAPELHQSGSICELKMHQATSRQQLNHSFGSDIFAVFNQTDIELQQTGDEDGQAAAAATRSANVSYSTLGLVCPYKYILDTAII